MEVDNFEAGTSSEIDPIGQPATQTVTSTQIDFQIGLTYSDHPYFDHGKGVFSATLSKLTLSGWQTVDSQTKTLGNDNDDGTWTDTLTVSVIHDGPGGAVSDRAPLSDDGIRAKGRVRMTRSISWRSSKWHRSAISRSTSCP